MFMAAAAGWGALVNIIMAVSGVVVLAVMLAQVELQVQAVVVVGQQHYDIAMAQKYVQLLAAAGVVAPETILMDL
jgi:putative cell wall-binding protein